jgi:transposase
MLPRIQLKWLNPAYTSQMCSSCYHIGKRTNKVFKCTNQNCKVDTVDADVNASHNIALLGGSVNNREKSAMLFCSLHN